MASKAFFIMRLNDHVQYLKRIDAALKGQNDFQGTDHYQCKLGKWLYGEGLQEIARMKNPRAKDVFQSMLEPHERFHTLGKQALAKQQIGDMEGAKQALTELHTYSTLLSNKLLELDMME